MLWRGPHNPSTRCALCRRRRGERYRLREGAEKPGQDPNHPDQVLPNIPNGLGPGALHLSGTPNGALSPVQSQSGAVTEVTIRQTSQQALLNWAPPSMWGETHI